MAEDPRHTRGKAGDWVEVNVIGGGPSRYGIILEVLGAPGHEHYRIRWDEDESLHFPAQGARILEKPPASAGG